LTAAFDQPRRASLLANSYTRIEVVIRAFGSMSRLDWFALLGSEWTICDKLWRARAVLKGILRDASRAELDAMMEQAERDTLAPLPSRITVYRGCYKMNRSGLSWSLNRAVAERFPSLLRYRHEGDQPLLLTGTVSRDRVVLKIDRDEQEVIAAQVKVVSTEPVTLAALD
jgi:hypothetical protein